MTDLVRLLVEIIGFIWPFRMVDQWETGVYYVAGRARRLSGAQSLGDSFGEEPLPAGESVVP